MAGDSCKVSGTREITGVSIAAMVAFCFWAIAFWEAMRAKKSNAEKRKKDITFTDDKEWDEYFETKKFNNEDKKKWEDYVQNHPDIGVITLAFMHSRPGTKMGVEVMEWYIKILLFLIPIFQIAITITVFVNQFKGYEFGTCPSTGSKSSRTIGLCVGALYMIKVGFLLCQKMYLADMGGSVLNRGRTGGMLQYYVLADEFMNIDYEFAVYLYNLWIVFMTIEPLDMVLNALALEFIMQFDDEVKRIYMDIYPVDKDAVQRFMKANGGPGEGTDPEPEPTEGRWDAYSLYENFLFFPIVIHLPITLGALVHFGAVVIPVCKP